ncbi:hypothetical protein TNCV_2149161 [Trichonephila clavipes]|nr:hypothetical protein TNCV_2149161 [Trichonephila clavipes]
MRLMWVGAAAAQIELPYVRIGRKDDSKGSVLQDLKFVNVGFGRTTPDLACVGQNWLEVLQVDLSFAIAGEVDSNYVGAASLGDDCGVVCEEADMNCWCGGEVVREDII